MSNPSVTIPVNNPNPSGQLNVSASSSSISPSWLAPPTAEVREELLPKDFIKTTQFPSTCSKFTSIHRLSLNITIRNTVNTNLFGTLSQANYDENLLLVNLTKFDLTNLNLDSRHLIHLKYKGFAKQLSRAIANDPLTNSSESPSGNIGNYILNKLNYSGNELMLNIQPKLKFDMFGENIRAKPDFGVERIDGKHLMIIDENCELMISNEMGECQISAEILAVAFKNFSNPNLSSFRKDQVIFALRIIGTRFTFYRATVTRAYINSIRIGLPSKSESVLIERYPPDNDEESFYGLDYAEGSNRPVILRLLLNLREYLKNS